MTSLIRIPDTFIPYRKIEDELDAMIAEWRQRNIPPEPVEWKKRLNKMRPSVYFKYGVRPCYLRRIDK